MEKLLAVTTEATFAYVDWAAFRREAAKDILCSMVRGGYNHGREKEQAKLAVMYADELIKQLKGE